MWPSLPVSLQLMLYAQVLALIIAIPLGVLTAYRNGTWFDRMSNTSAFALLAIPNFALALVLAYYVGGRSSGGSATRASTSSATDPPRTWRRWSCPSITLAVGQIAVYMRLLRSDMIATLQEDFITMAKAKGMLDPAHPVPPRAAAVEPHAAHRGRPQRRHAHRRRARSSRSIFAHPRHRLRCCPRPSRPARYVALQRIVAIIAICYVLVNFVVDILYTVLDPRIRHARADRPLTTTP